jgi:hypothetical protein
MSDRMLGWLEAGIKRMLFVLVGSIFLLSGAGTMYGAVHMVQTGHRTTGVVVANERYDSTRGGPTYYPVVRFVAQGGQTYVVRSTVGADHPEFRPGEAVTVYYDPRHPQTALIDSDQLWLSPLEFILVGTVIVLVGAWPLLRRLRRRTHTQTRKSPIRPRRSAPARRHRQAPARRH